MRYAEPVAVAFGGASGLGQATARRLLHRGMTVVIAGLPNSPGSSTANALGDRAAFVSTDVTDPGQVREAFNQASALGSARAAVNCARRERTTTASFAPSRAEGVRHWTRCEVRSCPTRRR